MSFRARITAGLGVIALLVSAAAVIGASLVTRAELDQEVDAFLKERARELSEGSRNRDDPRRGDSDRPDGGGDGNGRPGGDPLRPIANLDAVTQLLDRRGDVVATLGAESPLPVDEADRDLAGGRGPARLRTVTVDGTEFRVITTSTPDGAVQIARDRSETNSVIGGLRSRLLVVGLAATATAALLGWLLARRLTRPVEDLDRAAAEVAATEDLSTRVPVSGSDEIGRLATSFNAMVGALEESREQQRRLVMDASHELRTPLTSLRTNIDLVQRADELPADDRERLLADVSSELHELSDLVSELVELATDSQAEAEPLVSADLGGLVDEVVTASRRRSAQEIRLEAEDAAEVEVRPTMIQRAVRNLVDNAIKYGGDGPIDVTVDGAVIRVRDRGPGVAAAERERIFDRFYRSDEARTEPGSGLGLSIVRQIVDRHGGRVHVDDVDEADSRSGAVFTIDLG